MKLNEKEQASLDYIRQNATRYGTCGGVPNDPKTQDEKRTRKLFDNGLILYVGVGGRTENGWMGGAGLIPTDMFDETKHWIDLLGRNTDYAHVDCNRIVRDDPETRRITILWAFDNQKQAEDNFQAWLLEVIKEPPPGSWASVARIMAQNDDSDFDWDAWKHEMKERDM